MPFLRIFSNAPLKDRDAAQCAVRAAELISEKTGKPLTNIVVLVSAEQPMCFEGSSNNKGVLAYLDAIGFSEKSDLIKLLTEFLHDRFEDVDLDSINIVLTDMAAANVAKAGRLFG